MRYSPHQQLNVRQLRQFCSNCGFRFRERILVTGGPSLNCPRCGRVEGSAMGRRAVLCIGEDPARLGVA